MESSFTESIARLELIDMAMLLLVTSIIAYLTLFKRIHTLMFLLVLSATMVGSVFPRIGNIAPIVRWLVIFSFLALGIHHATINVSAGLLLFWGYVLLGHLFLFNSIVIQYQLQKSVLLIMVAVMIPLLYANRSLHAFQESLEAIACAGSIFCIINFVSLRTYLDDPVRFSGFTRGAASLAIFLGGLLPFTFWGVWKAHKWIRILCIFGFLSGIATIIFSGQRTGTIIGIIGIIPLFLGVQNRRTLKWTVILFLVLSCLGIYLYQQSSEARRSYLFHRFFNQELDLSGRNEIWKLALDEITATPILGRGIGASEMVFGPSFHNTYLEVWYNTGFPGLTLFILSQLYFLFQTIRQILISKDAQVRGMATLAMGYILGFIAMGLFESMGASSSSINLILYLFLCFLVTAPVIQSLNPSSLLTSPRYSRQRPLSGATLFQQAKLNPQSPKNQQG